MSVVALAPYEFTPRDVRENFPAPLLFIGWEDHLMFSAPVVVPLPAEMLFGDLCAQVLPSVYSAHPDFQKIDWSQVEWKMSGQPWRPDPQKSLEANGLGHKSVIRFRTPGLNGINGSSN